MGAAKSGDRSALGQLLQQLRPYVRVLARAAHRGALSRQVDDSDLVQDAMVEVSRSFDRFQGDVLPEFLAWLRQVVSNTVHKTIRHSLGTQKRNAGDVVELNSDGPAGLASEQPDRKAEVREEAARVAAGLESLPDDMRRVLVMRLVDGQPHAAIAEELGRTESAVRMLFVRSVRRLQEILAE